MRHTLFNHATLEKVATLEGNTLTLEANNLTFDMLGRNVVDCEEGKYFLAIDQVVNFGSQPAEGQLGCLPRSCYERWVPDFFKVAGTLTGTIYIKNEEGELILHSVWSK